MDLQSSFFFDFMLLVHIEQTPFDAPALLKSIDLNPPQARHFLRVHLIFPKCSVLRIPKNSKGETYRLIHTGPQRLFHLPALREIEPRGRPASQDRGHDAETRVGFRVAGMTKTQFAQRRKPHRGRFARRKRHIASFWTVICWGRDGVLARIEREVGGGMEEIIFYRKLIVGCKRTVSSLMRLCEYGGEKIVMALACPLLDGSYQTEFFASCR